MTGVRRARPSLQQEQQRRATTVGPSAPRNSQRASMLVAEAAAQQRDAGRVGRVGDHGQAAAGDGAGDERLLERLVEMPSTSEPR